LCIGNSFSQDAARYLSPAAENQGIEIFVENLYIGGCSLERHYGNMLSGEKAYEKEVNGESTHEFVSLNDELQRENWDVVTIQQASHFSYNYETYEPFATELVKYIRKNQQDAKVFIHFTWAYEENSQRLFENGFSTRKEMFEKIKESYGRAFKSCGADGIIPSGQVFENLAEKGFRCHRDTFHATLGAGRYALALAWIKALTGADISVNTFTKTDEPLSEAEILKIKEAVNEAFEN
ncbi:MAG: DUF4886 domain-containing protein, partial [Clostridia bacterium]|nr:DUF4886 domain-containing protein [Clostridia bacterium]